MTARQPWVCPDRGAVPVERQLVHEDTCPLGAAQDKVAAGDRGYFEAHPHTQLYSRPISRSEVLELKVIGVIPDGWDAAGYVTVTRVGPGVRARSFDGIRIFPRGVVA